MGKIACSSALTHPGAVPTPGSELYPTPTTIRLAAITPFASISQVGTRPEIAPQAPTPM